jgi:hypothetical protein
MAQMYTVQLLSYAIFTEQTMLKLMEKVKQWMQESVKMCQKQKKKFHLGPQNNKQLDLC